MWFLLLPLWFVFNLLALLLAPVLALFFEDRAGFCDNGNSYGVEPRLPTCLSWFATEDNSLLGDAAWRSMAADHWHWRARFAPWPALQAYLGRLGWLWRNPAYGFERSVLAASIAPSDTVACRGDPLIQDGSNGREGYCYTTIGDYWNLVLIRRIGHRCVKVDLGWKLKTYAEQPGRVHTEPTAQYVVSARLARFSS